MLGHSPLSSAPLSSQSGLMVFYQTVTASISIAASFKIDISKILTAITNVAAFSIKFFTKNLQASATIMSAELYASRQFSRVMTVYASTSAILLALVQKLQTLVASITIASTREALVHRLKVISASINVSAEFSRVVSKLLAAVVSAYAALVRTPMKTLASSATIAPILTWLVRKLKTLSGSMHASSLILKTPNKVLPAVTSIVSSIKRDIFKHLTAVVSARAVSIYDIARIVREYLWARSESAKLWAQQRSERLVAMSQDAKLLVQQATKRLWK